MRLILLLILLLLVIGALPTWPYSTGWGYYPSWAGRRSVDCLVGSPASLATGETGTIVWRANAAIDLLRLTPCGAMG
jgi:hypothetical protein